MSNAEIVPVAPFLPALLVEEIDSAAVYARASRAVDSAGLCVGLAVVGGHPLRAGCLTEAARQGASIFKMREVSRHKSLEVLSDYVRNNELFRDHAGEKFL